MKEKHILLKQTRYCKIDISTHLHTRDHRPPFARISDLQFQDQFRHDAAI